MAILNRYFTRLTEKLGNSLRFRDDQFAVILELKKSACGVSIKGALGISK